MSKLSYKTLFIIFFFLLIGVIVLSKFALPNQKVSAAWWNDMWQYRVAVSVNNSTNFDATNIPYKVTLDTASLITAGKLQIDADDIRIVNQNGEIVRSQVEKKTLNTSSTRIWFEATVKSNSSSSYYIYYGNSSVNAPVFENDINTFTSTSTSTTVEMKDGFGYTTSSSHGRISDIRKDGNNLGTNGNFHYSGTYPGNWWDDRSFTQTILNSNGPLFVEINYADNNYGSYSSFGTNIKIFDNGFAETQMFMTYNTSGSENHYYYLQFDSGTRNSVWVNGSGTLVDQDADSGNLTENSLGQNWFGQRWTATGIYGGTIITKNGSDWINGYTSTRASYFQTNYSYTQSFTSGSSREVRYGVFAGNGGLTEMTQKGANYGALGSTTATEEIGTGPIAYWKFDEGVGTTVYDSSSNGKNGYFASTAPAWADESQCISGKCLSFNGTQSAFSNYDVSWNNSNNISISFWVKPQNITDVNRGILGKKNAGYEWSFYQSNSAVSFVHWDNTGNHTNGMDDSWGNVLTANKWTHLVYSWNGSVSKFYANGKLVKTKTAINPSINMNQTNNMMFGGNIYTWGDSYFRGFIDEVKIYSYVRTADQIKLDYNSRGSSKGSSANLGVQSNTIPSLTSSLAAYWKFDEGIGTSVFDSSINKTNGYFAGATKPIWTTGKYNSGIAFSGVNDSVIIPYRPNFRDAFTVSIWMKRTTGYNQLTDVMLLSPPNAWYFYDSYNSGTIRGDVYIDGIRRAGITVPVPFDGNWYHIAYTYDSATHFAKMYKNGILYGRTELTGLANYLIDTATGNISNIGLNNSGRGMILDEPRIYNRALTAEEIKQDYDKKTATNFGTNTQTIGATTTNLDYCIPGDTSYCASPVAEWKMDEKTGTTIKDTSGNNNTGTFGTGNSSPTWTTGKIGAGLDFDRNDYVNNGVTQGHTGNLNVNFWIKTNSSTTGTIVSKYGNNGYWTYRIYTDSNGKINFERSNNTTAWINTLTSNKVINDNNWHFISANYDSTNMYIYIDGQLDNSVAENRTADGTNYYNFCIGNDHHYCTPAGTKGFFNGKIDHVKIYNYARTPAQIAYDYNRGEPVGWWKLDECQGNVAKDSSGIGNSGTIIIGASGSQTSLGTCQIGTSAAWTNGATGKFNSSLNFDGADDRIVCNDSTALQTNLNSNTIAFWFKSNTTSDCGFIRKATSNLNGYFVAMNSSGKISARLADNTNTVTTPASTKSYNDNNWHHVTTIINRNTQKLDIYIDGIYLANTSSNISTLNNISNTSSLSIGSGYGAGAPYGNSCNAQIDDVRIYNYALTSEQIKILYNGGAVSFN